MDLFEDFDRARSAGLSGDLGDLPLGLAGAAAAGAAGAASADAADAAALAAGGAEDAAALELPTLSLEVAARQAARGRGAVVAAAAAADTVVLATARGFLLRYRWDEHGNERGAFWKAVWLASDAEGV